MALWFNITVGNKPTRVPSWDEDKVFWSINKRLVSMIQYTVLLSIVFWSFAAFISSAYLFPAESKDFWFRLSMIIGIGKQFSVVQYFIAATLSLLGGGLMQEIIFMLGQAWSHLKWTDHICLCLYVLFKLICCYALWVAISIVMIGAVI